MEMVTDIPEEAPTINIEGKKGESIFYRPLGWTLQEDLKLISGYFEEYERVIGESEEERLLALVGNLSIEEALDYFLAAYIPRYKKYLSESRDFTFSMKIDIGRSLCLIPKHLLDAADLVRKIRNEFAHNLQMKSFDSLKVDTKRKLSTFCKVFFPKDDGHISYSEKFARVADAVILGFEVYSSHVRIARKFIYSDDFTNELKKRVVIKTGNNKRQHNIYNIPLSLST